WRPIARAARVDEAVRYTSVSKYLRAKVAVQVVRIAGPERERHHGCRLPGGNRAVVVFQLRPRQGLGHEWETVLGDDGSVSSHLEIVSAVAHRHRECRGDLHP